MHPRTRMKNSLRRMKELGYKGSITILKPLLQIEKQIENQELKHPFISEFIIKEQLTFFQLTTP